MEWVRKKARLSCLLRFQCLAATLQRGHLKPVSPIPPSHLSNRSQALSFSPSQPPNTVWMQIQPLLTMHEEQLFFFFKPPWNYKGVSTPWLKTVESSYKTWKQFRVQYCLIPLHRLKLVLPWKVSAEVKCDWKLSHHTLLEAFSKREMHKNFSLLLFEGVPLPPSLPFTPFSQETEKYFFACQQALHEKKLQFLFRKNKT